MAGICASSCNPTRELAWLVVSRMRGSSREIGTLRTIISQNSGVGTLPRIGSNAHTRASAPATCRAGRWHDVLPGHAALELRASFPKQELPQLELKVFILPADEPIALAGSLLQAPPVENADAA